LLDRGDRRVPAKGEAVGPDGAVWVALREPSTTSSDDPEAHRLWRVDGRGETSQSA
jgi:hypothetical protein